ILGIRARPVHFDVRADSQDRMGWENVWLGYVNLAWAASDRMNVEVKASAACLDKELFSHEVRLRSSSRIETSLW
ncbi:MAG: hypothetical protein ACR2P3_11120, partial [Geminicoccaceae bacterium]